MSIHSPRPFILLLLCILATGKLKADEPLRILTSMPNTLYQPFVTAFERKYPNIRILTLNKNTNFAVDEIVRGNARKFDLFWASSPEAFELLVKLGALQAPHSTSTSAKNLGVLTLDHPQQLYRAFALSGVGWCWNTATQLTPPKSWQNLLNPQYTGTIGIARPSRSGTTHMLVEQVLQDYGWQSGWAFLLELSANLSTVTSRSFGVIDGVRQGRFDIGLTIDFLAQSDPSQLIAFRYRRPIMLTPARIALLKGGELQEKAEDFIAFVLSDEGQQILRNPDINRIPVSDKVRAEMGVSLANEVRAAIKLSWTQYNPQLARERYWSVNSLFDQFITFPLKRRRNAWRRLRILESVSTATSDKQLRIIRTHLLSMPVDEKQTQQQILNASPGPGSRFVAVSAEQRETEAHWISLANGGLDKIEKLLTLAEHTLK